MDALSAVALDAMRNDALRLERIATNLANVTTPGFKREMLVAGGPRDAAPAAAMPIGGDADGATTPPWRTAQVMRDMRQGTVKHTGQPLDLALMGPGMFELASDAGRVYTRHGQFHVDGQGRVVNEQGHRLMAEGGEITLTSTDVSVDAAGNVSESGRLVATVKVVEFEKSAPLESIGGGLYRANGGVRAGTHDATYEVTRIRQAHLENANVDVSREMVELTRTMRHFEAMQRLVQGHGEMLGTAIRKLGDF